MGRDSKSLHEACDLAQLYVDNCNSAPEGTRIVVQSSQKVEENIGSIGILPEQKHPEENIVLVGCGGQHTQPEGFYDLEVQFFGIQCVVPCLVVPSQRDDLILGSNIIKHLIYEFKNNY